jgi:hypothetical protein
MYIMYVDESGDPGVHNSPTNYFILSALVLHESCWRSALDELISFRKHLRDTTGLKLREEIHATHFINKPGKMQRIPRHQRLDIIKQCIDWVALRTSNIKVISVVINKRPGSYSNSEDVFYIAWETLIQRYENTIKACNFCRPARYPAGFTGLDNGLIISDNTDSFRLTKLVRKMRRYNSVPNDRSFFADGSRNLPLNFIAEDAFMKDSAVSYFHQVVDVIAYCARQIYEPNAYMKKKGGVNFYRRLTPVILRQANPRHHLGIVER